MLTKCAYCAAWAEYKMWCGGNNHRGPAFGGHCYYACSAHRWTVTFCHGDEYPATGYRLQQVAP